MSKNTEKREGKKAEKPASKGGGERATPSPAPQVETRGRGPSQGPPLSAIFDDIEEVVVYVSDPETYELLYFNDAFRQSWNGVLGEQCYKVLQGRDAPCPFCSNPKIFGENLGRTYSWEFQNEVTKRWYRCLDKALDWPNGRKVRFEMAIDITALKDAEEVMRKQADEIIELSTPVIPIWRGVVVAPLIGSLDSRRAASLAEDLLTRVAETQSQVVLLDVTGLAAIDTQVAQHLIDTITAVRLLGARIVLTGMRPAIAQTLTHLGIDLSGVATRSSLAGGLQIAFQEVGMRIVDEKAEKGRRA